MVKICLLLSWQGIEVGFMKNLIGYNLMNESVVLFFFLALESISRYLINIYQLRIFYVTKI